MTKNIPLFVEVEVDVYDDGTVSADVAGYHGGGLAQRGIGLLTEAEREAVADAIQRCLADFDFDDVWIDSFAA